MSMVLLAQKAFAAHYSSRVLLADPSTSPSSGSGTIPNPRPKPPPGLQGFGNDLVSWMKWIGIIACLGGLIACGVMMAAGRRNRNEMAVQGVIGLPWVLAGTAVIAGAAGIVGSFALG